MSATTKELTTYARFLRNAAPQAFDDFLAAFAKYHRDQADILVVTSENLQLAQGHAQQCKKILDALEEVKRG